MLERIKDLPEQLWGLRASGTVTKEDYEQTVLPYLEECRRKGCRIRLVYVLGPDFEAFTPAALWEDLRIDLKYLRLFERCAVVSDASWLRGSLRAVLPFVPFPMKVFKHDDFDAAIDWITTPPPPALGYRFIAESSVLLVEPHGKLSAEDFNALEGSADTWIELSGGKLHGLVVHAPNFPGWENVGSFFRHLRFVREHHQKINRIALVVGGSIAKLAPRLSHYFIMAEVKAFDEHQLDHAIEWASGPKALPDHVQGNNNGPSNVGASSAESV